VAVELGDEPEDQVVGGVGAVVGAVAVEEGALVRGEPEPGGEGEAVVGEVEPVAVGEDVAEVGVHVQESAVPEEGGEVLQALFDEATDGLGFPRGELGAEPVVQGVREVLQEQRDTRGGGAQRLDASAYPLGAAPVADGRLHVGQFTRQEPLFGLGQHPPVVQQRKGLRHLAGARRAHHDHPLGADGRVLRLLGSRPRSVSGTRFTNTHTPSTSTSAGSWAPRRAVGRPWPAVEAYQVVA